MPTINLNFFIASDAVVLQGQADQVQRYLDIEKAFQKDFHSGKL